MTPLSVRTGRGAGNCAPPFLEEDVERYKSFDYIKLVSYAGVIVYHYLIGMEFSGRASISAGAVFQAPLLTFVTVFVSLFFMLSGAGLTLSAEKKGKFSAWEFYKKHFVRLLLPFYIAYLMDLALYLLFTGGLPFPADMPKKRIIFTLLGMDEFMAMMGYPTFTLGVGEWFLGCLVLFYLVYPLVYAALKKAGALTFLFTTGCYVYLVLTYRWRIPPHQNLILRGYEFLLGAFLALHLNRLKRASLLVTIPLMVVCLLGLPGVTVPYQFANTVFTVAAVISAVTIERWIRKEDAAGSEKKIGRVTKVFLAYAYEVFLVHHFILAWFQNCLPEKVFPTYAVWLLLIPTLGLIWAAAVVVRITEKGIQKALQLH